MSNRSDKIVAIKPLTDSSNSFVRLFSDAIARQGYQISDFDWNGIERGNANVAILHWPHELTGFGGLKGIRPYLGFRRRIAMARAKGARIIWVAHNARPHDSGWVSTMLMRRFVRSIDGIVHFSHHSRELIAALYTPPARITQIETVHGHYLDAMETPFQAATPAEARVKLVYFGQIRRYKNVDLLAQIAAGLPSELSLMIGGRRSHEDVACRIEQIAASAPNIKLDLRAEALPDADIERLVDAGQGIVLPYQAILNSGAAIFALSRGRPVLAPNIGSLPELQAIVGPEWLQLYDGEISAADVERFADWLRQRSSPEQPDLSALSWDRVGGDIAGLIDRLLA